MVLGGLHELLVGTSGNEDSIKEVSCEILREWKSGQGVDGVEQAGDNDENEEESVRRFIEHRLSKTITRRQARNGIGREGDDAAQSFVNDDHSQGRLLSGNTSSHGAPNGIRVHGQSSIGASPSPAQLGSLSRVHVDDAG